MLQFLVGLLDRGALPGQNAEALLHLPQLVQVAVLGLGLQRQPPLLRKERRQRGERPLQRGDDYWKMMKLQKERGAELAAVCRGSR